MKHRGSRTRRRKPSLWRRHILSHEQFEELSALAAVGEISHDDWLRLKSHLEECAQCRCIFADVGEIHAKWLPEHPDFEMWRDATSDERLRKAILRRVTKEGARFSKPAQSAGRIAEEPDHSWRMIPIWVAVG